LGGEEVKRVLRKLANNVSKKTERREAFHLEPSKRLVPPAGIECDVSSGELVEGEEYFIEYDYDRIKERKDYKEDSSVEWRHINAKAASVVCAKHKQWKTDTTRECIQAALVERYEVGSNGQIATTCVPKLLLENGIKRRILLNLDKRLVRVRHRDKKDCKCNVVGDRPKLSATDMFESMFTAKERAPL
jgi:hypothetical protein